MPLPFFHNRAIHQAKRQWKMAYRQFRLRRNAGVETLSESEVVRKAHAAYQSLQTRQPRRWFIWLTAIVGLIITLPGRILGPRR